MSAVNVFYAPELGNPPLAPECSVTFTTIGKATGETVGTRLCNGVNRVAEEEWENIKEKEAAKRLLSLGALRVMEADEVKETLEADDLHVPDDVSLADLKLQDATKVASTTHDLQRLEAWLTDEQRNPVRQAITRQINKLTNGD